MDNQQLKNLSRKSFDEIVRLYKPKDILNLTLLRLTLEHLGFVSNSLKDPEKFIQVLPNISDSISAIKENGYHLPPWANNLVMVNLEKYKYWTTTEIINGDIFLQNKMGGEVFNHIKQHFTDVIASLETSEYYNSYSFYKDFDEIYLKKSLRMYQVHEYNLVALINILGGNCIARPKESSAIIVELYRIPSSNKIAYDTLLINKLQKT
ncbi:unnamed protein product [Gordionus sp. m RMFG-2023]